jgi:hypothetical protein
MDAFIIYPLASSIILWIGIVWIGLAVVVGVAANTRGRSGGGWFLLAVLISPLIAGLLVLALPRKERPPGYGITFFLARFNKTPVEKRPQARPSTSRAWRNSIGPVENTAVFGA